MMYWDIRLAPAILAAFVLLVSPHLPSGSVRAQDTGSWTNINTANTPIERHENAFVEVDGKFYLVGGRGLKRVQIYDPATETWTNGATPPFQMHHFQAVTRDGLIYVIGAYTGTCCDSEYGIDHVYIYNTANDTWTQSHEVPADRRRGSAGAAFYNGKIYLVGGIEGGHGAPATGYRFFDEYDPATGQWKVLPNAPRKRDHYHAVVYSNKLYLIGGRDTSNPNYTSANIGEIDVYNFTTGTWSTLPAGAELPTVRAGAATVLFQGEILVIGGESNSHMVAHDETEAFNPVDESWRTLAPLNVGRHGTQAVVYDNAVYVAAGSAQRGGEPELDSIERFDNDGAPDPVSLDLTLDPGWNLMGLPLTPVSAAYDAIFAEVPLVAGQLPMTWDGASYVEAEALSVGTAYWVHIDESASAKQTQSIAGTPVSFLQIPLSEGWNMISGPSCGDLILRGISTDPIAAIPVNALYRFDGGYVPAFTSNRPRGTIEQGEGYWVFAEENAVLTLDCGPTKRADAGDDTPAVTAHEAFHKVVVRDAEGRQQALYFGRRLDRADLRSAYLLPPRPSRGAFDARFPDDARLAESAEAVVKFQSTRYPVTLDLAAPGVDAATYEVDLLLAGQPVQTLTLAAGARVTIDDTAIQSARIRLLDSPVDAPAAPVAHAGAYPNPVVDRGAIVYELTEDAEVTVEVFDVLGRSMRREQGRAAAGSQRLSFDATDWPAGLYLYRIRAEGASRQTTVTGRMMRVR